MKYKSSREKMQKVNSNTTEAINDEGYKQGTAQVPVVPQIGVEEAKDWVDNGSRL